VKNAECSHRALRRNRKYLVDTEPRTGEPFVNQDPVAIATLALLENVSEITADSFSTVLARNRGANKRRARFAF
jgi:hypothetical protein